MFVIENKEQLEELRKSGKIVVLDFWAEWCSQCKMMFKGLEQVENELSDKVVVAKVEADKVQDLAKEYGVRNLPSLFILDEEKIVANKAGMQPPVMLKQWIENNI